MGTSWVRVAEKRVVPNPCGLIWVGWEGLAGKDKSLLGAKMVALVAMVMEPLGQLGEVLAQEGRRGEWERGQEENQVWEEGQQCQRLLGGP